MRPTFTLLVLVGSTLRLAAEPPSSVPAPLPEKNGSQLVIGVGTGTTREDALKAAYASAVGQVAETLVARERLTGANDTVLKNLILTAANGVVSEAKEISATETAGLWRVRVQGKVAPLKLSAEITKAALPLRKVDVDGEGDFAKITSRQQAGRDAAAWFAYLLKDYPFGCSTAQVVTSEIVPEKTDEKKATYAVRVRHAIDMETYAKIAAVLEASLDHLSVHPSQPFSYRYEYWPKLGGNPNKVKGDTPYEVSRTLRDDLAKLYDKRQFVFVAVTNKATKVAVQFDPQDPTGFGYEVAGRCYFLPPAVADVFDATKSGVRLGTRVMLKDADGKVVAEHIDGKQYISVTALSLLGGWGYKSEYHFMPKVKEGGYGSPGDVKPVHEMVYFVELPLDAVLRVKKADVEVILVPK